MQEGRNNIIFFITYQWVNTNQNIMYIANFSIQTFPNPRKCLNKTSREIGYIFCTFKRIFDPPKSRFLNVFPMQHLPPYFFPNNPHRMLFMLRAVLNQCIFLIPQPHTEIDFDNLPIDKVIFTTFSTSIP